MVNSTQIKQILELTEDDMPVVYLWLLSLVLYDYCGRSINTECKRVKR